MPAICYILNLCHLIYSSQEFYNIEIACLTPCISKKKVACTEVDTVQMAGPGSLSKAHAVFPAPWSLMGWHICLCLSLRLGCTSFEGKNLAWLIFPCLEWFSPKFPQGFLHQHFLQFSAQMSPYQSDFHWPPYINSSYTSNHELYIFTLLHLFCSTHHHLTRYIFVSSFMLSPL